MSNRLSRRCEDGSGLIDRRELVEMLRASFVVEGFSPEELEERADKARATFGCRVDGEF